MRSQAPYADLLLRQAGRGGLWEWAMDQRRSVRPKSWSELAELLTRETNGQIQVKGEMLRKWLLSAEAARAAQLTPAGARR